VKLTFGGGSMRAKTLFFSCLFSILSAGQAEELSRVEKEYPEMIDSAFVASHRDLWMS